MYDHPDLVLIKFSADYNPRPEELPIGIRTQLRYVMDKFWLRQMTEGIQWFKEELTIPNY